VAVTLDRRAAVRHAAVDRYLLPTAKIAAVAHASTDGRTPCRSIDPAPSLPQIGDINTARN